MSDSPEENQATRSTYPPRVVADFGGRRKIFERRLRQIRIEHADRRSGYDRRSGFDRRGTFGENIQYMPQRRKNSRATPPPATARLRPTPGRLAPRDGKNPYVENAGIQGSPILYPF
jgi:hypothetical protein